jgi:type IV pilus assembly protein PilA
MLARIRKSLENREEGFTLIELLVVMVIIGILAAIAIPSFLAQRDKGYQAAEKSDLKTVSIAEQSYATDNNGAYYGSATLIDSTDTTSPLALQGAKVSGNDTVKATLYTSTGGVAGDSYTLCAASSKTKVIYILDSKDDTPVKQPASVTTCP